MGKYIDLTGRRFGKLTVIKRVENKITNNGQIKVQFLCKCDCGKETIVLSNSLKSGLTKSCGCIYRTHNMTNSKIYNVWQSIKTRCFNKNSKSYKEYGGRGIKMCEEWLHEFQAFYNWAIENGYKDGLTIDRIDNNGNYTKENCRWVTMKEQSNNKRTSKYITYNNETHTMAEWSYKLGGSKDLISKRLASGWSIEKALTTSVVKKRINGRTLY